jgi:hypothetical protein
MHRTKAGQDYFVQATTSTNKKHNSLERPYVFSCSSNDVVEMMAAAASASDRNLIMDGWFINVSCPLINIEIAY